MRLLPALIVGMCLAACGSKPGEPLRPLADRFTGPPRFDRDERAAVQDLRTCGACNACATDEVGIATLTCMFRLPVPRPARLGLGYPFQRTDRACHDGVRALTARDAAHVLVFADGRRLALAAGRPAGTLPADAEILEVVVANPHDCEHVAYAFAVSD